MKDDLYGTILFVTICGTGLAWYRHRLIRAERERRRNARIRDNLNRPW